MSPGDWQWPVSIRSQLFHASVRHSPFLHVSFEPSTCQVSDAGLWSPGEASCVFLCSLTNWSLGKEMSTVDMSMLQVWFTVVCPIENSPSFTAATTHCVFISSGLWFISSWIQLIAFSERGYMRASYWVYGFGDSELFMKPGFQCVGIDGKSAIGFGEKFALGHSWRRGTTWNCIESTSSFPLISQDPKRWAVWLCRRATIGQGKPSALVWTH